MRIRYVDNPIKTIQWLYLMYKVRRQYYNLLFSRREKFMAALQPIASSRDGYRIAWPDGIFVLKPHDYERALKETQHAR